MLPLGHLGPNPGAGETRETNFTKDEQRSLMTLWSIFRSPLMMGGNLPALDKDDWTTSLLTNQEVIDVDQHSKDTRAVITTDTAAVWLARPENGGGYYLAVFNIGDTDQFVKREWKELGVPEAELNNALKRVTEALLSALDDPRARWVLSPHQDARTEWRLSGVLDGKVVEIAIDRSFVDAHGVRWIVDYKTGIHEGASLEGFLDNERLRYREQLERYATLLARMDSRPIRLALYFPLVKGWRESLALTAEQALQSLEPYCSGFLCTYVDKEGMMQGTDVAWFRRLRNATSLELTAAGGITTLDDVRALLDLRINAAVGMAVYTGKLDLEVLRNLT
jgi:hypothetical protein